MARVYLGPARSLVEEALVIYLPALLIATTRLEKADPICATCLILLPSLLLSLFACLLSHALLAALLDLVECFTEAELGNWAIR